MNARRNIWCLILITAIKAKVAKILKNAIKGKPEFMNLILTRSEKQNDCNSKYIWNRNISVSYNCSPMEQKEIKELI